MVQISVILPVYNIKKDYLVKAVRSVLAQDFKDFELLIIDDGSNQDTAKNCDALAAEDKRIVLFHNKNQGPGKSRNFGLRQSKGKYVIFMDHDDWVEPQWLSLLYGSIFSHESDVAFCYADEYSEECDSFYDISYPHFVGEKFIVDDVLRQKMANVFLPPWAKLVKADFIKKYDLQFAEDGNRFDDVLFHIFLNERARTVSFVDKTLYHHRVFSNSITATSWTNTDMYFDVFKTIESTIKKCEAEGLSVKRILDRSIDFFCSVTDVVQSRKEFVSKMTFYIKKYGLKNVLRQKRYKKIKNWFFYINCKKGILTVLGISIINKRQGKQKSSV